MTRPSVALLLPLGLIGAWLAWETVAFPLGLAGIPTLLAAILGSNPLPKGGTTFLFAAWILLAILIALMRRHERIATLTLMSLPVAMTFVLLGLMLLRLGPSAAQSYGSTKLQLYVANNVIFLLGAAFAGASPRGRRIFFLVTLLVVFAGSLYLLFELLTGTLKQQYNGRFAINQQEGPIYLGRDSATGVLIATYFILVSTSRKARWLAAAALPTMIVSLIAAGSRGPVVAFVAGFGVMLALSAATGRARRQLGAVIGLLLVAAVLVPLVLPGSSIGRALGTIIGSASGLSSNGRSAIYAQAYSEFARHTWFGLGTGGFAAVNPANAYPHNILLEVGVELGVIGLLALVVMVWTMAARLLSVWRRGSGPVRLEASLLIGLLVMSLVNACFSGAIQDNRDIWIWGGLGLAMYARQRLVAGARLSAAAKRPRSSPPQLA